MAISFKGSTGGAVGFGGQTSLSFSHDNQGTFLVVFACIRDSSSDVTSLMRYGGVDLTKVSTQIHPSNHVSMFWVLQRPVKGSNTFQWNLSAGRNNMHAIVASYSGQREIDAVHKTGSNQRTGPGTLGVTLNNEIANVAQIAGFFQAFGSGSITTNSPLTTRHNTSGHGSITRLADAIPRPVGNTTTSFSFSGDAGSHLLTNSISIDPRASGGGSLLLQMI